MGPRGHAAHAVLAGRHGRRWRRRQLYARGAPGTTGARGILQGQGGQEKDNAMRIQKLFEFQNMSPSPARDSPGSETGCRAACAYASREAGRSQVAISGSAQARHSPSATTAALTFQAASLQPLSSGRTVCHTTRALACIENQATIERSRCRTHSTMHCVAAGNRQRGSLAWRPRLP